MTSSESGELNVSSSSTAGKTVNTDATARFGITSSDTDEAFATPAMAMIGDQGEAQEGHQFHDDDEGPEFASSYIIADAVMQSLSSMTMTASHILGAEGSSGSRQKSRSPPPGLALRDRSTPGTPPSRGSRGSGSCHAAASGGMGGQATVTRRPSGSSAMSLSVDHGDIVYE
ncbi:MAG: hypothetical protein ACKPKO_00530, partial [Candidatus Fonsibacter sp.]